MQGPSRLFWPLHWSVDATGLTSPPEGRLSWAGCVASEVPDGSMGGNSMIRLTAERAREDVWSAALLHVLRLHRRLIRLERLLARVRRAEDSIFDEFNDRLIPERRPHVIHVDRLLQEGLRAEALHLQPAIEVGHRRAD